MTATLTAPNTTKTVRPLAPLSSSIFHYSSPVDEEWDAVIVGGGVVGLCAGMELSRCFDGSRYLFQNVLILEKGEPGCEQSTRNSGVIHAGIYYPQDTLRARLCVEGNPMLYGFCREHTVPFRNVGKYIVATSNEEEHVLEEICRRAEELKINVLPVRGTEVARAEPNIAAMSGLFFPSTGVINAGWYIKTLENILTKGCGQQICTHSKVVSIEPRGSGIIEVGYEHEGQYEIVATRVLINSAGLFSDEIASLCNPDMTHPVLPSRGEYYTFNRTRRSDLNYNGTNIYPVPEIQQRHCMEAIWPGVHITPQVSDNWSGDVWELSDEVLVGPLRPPGQEFDSKTDYESDRMPPQEFISRVAPFFPSLQVKDLRLGMTGIMTEIVERDFSIEKDSKYPNIIHLSGMGSPALTASLAIGRMVADIAREVIQ